MSLKSTETLLNIFFNTKGRLQSDTQTIDLTDKTSKLKKDLAARDLILLNKEPRGKTFKVNRELLDLGEKPSDNINTSSYSIRKKVLQQELNKLKKFKKGLSRKKTKIISST